MRRIPASAQIDRLRSWDSATVANAVESFGVRLPNTGFTDSSIHCLFPHFPPMVGYAATARIRTANPPIEGHTYANRTHWLNHILSIPEPRIVVLEDMDEPHGLGAFVGEMHANILRTLGCTGVVTNGAVRGLQTSRTIGLQMFAGNVSVSHAYAHVVDFGSVVTVGRMEVHTGDLLHGDLHGVQSIPLEIAERIPDAARRIVRYKEGIAALCRSGTFTLDRFRSALTGSRF